MSTSPFTSAVLSPRPSALSRTPSTSSLTSADLFTASPHGLPSPHSAPSSPSSSLPPLMAPPRDYAYLGTYLFLAGCLVFSFHSVLLLHQQATFFNFVYFTGASLFSLGSLCYAVDAEQRKEAALAPSQRPRKAS